ncbi:hypothetical protein E4T44_11293 [Aureobasidium sp. EXF-8845]|nr:hypothetical protein E4T44_11293 [Aureobasidium sp. EXF-8845]
MHFLKTTVMGAFALTSLVVAQAPRLAFTRTPTDVTAGQPVTVQYTAQNLAQILRARLSTCTDVLDNAVNGSYTWIPDRSLENASNYALQISQGYEVNYSGLITLSGGNAAAVSSAKSVTSSAQAAASSLTASAVSSIQSVIASYNSSLTNLTAVVSIQTSPPNPPTNTTAVIVVAPSVGTGLPAAPVHNTTIVSPTLTSGSSSGLSSTVTSVVTSSSGASARGSSSSTAASASSTGAAATMAKASTSVLALFVVAAVFFFQ